MREEKIQEGNAIFSRYPILKNATTFYDIPYSERNLGEKYFTHTPRNLQHATIKIGSKTLNIFNTQGIWGIDGVDNERRLKMCKVIADKTKNEKNVILSGDFNVKINTRSINQIEQHLTNIFKNRLKTTFNMKRKNSPKFADAVIDMIFVSKEIKVIDSCCPQVDISDHMPLVITFDF